MRLSGNFKVFLDAALVTWQRHGDGAVAMSGVMSAAQARSLILR